MATKPDIANLLEWFELNEASGNRTGSHNSIVLTDNGTVDSATGKKGSAADFDKTVPEYFTRAAPNTGLNIGAGSFTIVYWFNARSVVEKTAYNTIWKNSYTQSTGGVDTKLALNVGATYFQVAFQLYGSAGGSGIITVHSAGATLHKVDDLNKWWFIACVHDQSGQLTHIYSDTTGSLQIDESNDYSLSGIVPGSPSQDMAVGANGAGGNPFDGLVDELSIWNTNLSADEIAWLYNSGSGRAYADLAIEVFGGNSGRQIIGCQVYEDATRRNLLADWTFRVVDLAPELDEHGFGYLPLFVPMARDEAFRFYDNIPTAFIRLTDGLFTLYEGRIEDRSIVPGGLEIGAFGYWRAMFDVPYTALWSTKKSSVFSLVTEEDIAIWTPSKYYTEIKARSDLFIGLIRGESYAQDADVGGFFMRLPHLGSRSLAKVSFSYKVRLPTGWRFDFQTADDDFTNPTAEDTVTGDGTLKTGSISDTTLTANKEMVIFSIYNDTFGGDYDVDKEQIGVTWGSSPGSNESSQSISANTKTATKFTSARTFTATKMRAYFKSDFASGEKAKLGIYSDSGGSPSSLLVSSAEITGDGRDGYKTIDLASSQVISSGTVYWLAIITNSNASVRCYTNNHVSQDAASDTYSDGFASTWSGGSAGTLGLDIQAYTEDLYVLVYNLRIQTTTSSGVYGDEVVKDLISYVNGENSGQLSSSTALVQSPLVDMKEAGWEDARPGDIALELANLGDNNTPPGRYEVGVWEDQALFFRPRGDDALEWFTDVVDIRVNSTLDGMFNSVYAVYTNVLSQKRRTADADDTNSQNRYGIVRRAVLNATTDDGTEAGVYRDTHLEDKKDITPRAQVTATGLFTAAGARAPLYAPRPGDQLTLRNLPLSDGGIVDKIRTFRINRVTPSLLAGTVTIVPEGDLPLLEILIAQYTVRRWSARDN